LKEGCHIGGVDKGISQLLELLGIVDGLDLGNHLNTQRTKFES
jgi:hypothetical protein